MASSRIYSGQCIFCNKDISSNEQDANYTVTKRKTVQLFHGSCYRTYVVLGCDDWIDLEGKENEQCY